MIGPDAGTFDLVICDMCMDVMDGNEFCNTLRRSDDPVLRELPVLILTAVQDEMVAEVALQVGAVGVAHKPITIPSLQGYIESVVGLKLS